MKVVSIVSQPDVDLQRVHRRAGHQHADVVKARAEAVPGKVKIQTLADAIAIQRAKIPQGAVDLDLYRASIERIGGDGFGRADQPDLLRVDVAAILIGKPLQEVR